MTKNLPKVKVSMTGNGRGTVSIDGVDLPWVTAVRFSAAVDAPNSLKLEVDLCSQVEIEGPAEVVMRLADQLPKLKVVPPRPPPTSEPSSGDDAPPG